ncbi:MAG TPA: dihydrolipoamide acetyltransferase family protein [Dehalococcoidia bacterium]|nr:dihydrolipoamide acetyltransferase family protein [Dehalococcoidia bacterium]
MAAEVRMPQLGESVTEGTVVRWLKHPGDAVALDESLAEIETEKVNVEIPSPFAGTLAQLLVPEGETVQVGTLIATIEEAGAPIAAASAPSQAAVPAPAAAASAPSPRPVAAAPAAAGASSPRQPAPAFSATGPLGPASTAHGMFSTGESAPPAGAEPSGTPAGAPQPAPDGRRNGHGDEQGMAGRYSPAVLRLAREHNVDLGTLRGSGAGGRVTRKDVQAFVEGTGNREQGIVAALPGNLGEERAVFAPPMAQPVEPARAPEGREPAPAFQPPAAATPAQPAVLPSPAAAAALAPDEELEPLTPTRRAIAEHMARSVRTSPHAWMMVEVDVTRLVAYRAALKAEFAAHEGVDLTYMPFMIKALVAALKRHPRLNSSWSDAGVILKRRINIGIAVDTPQGLLVPVIHDADDLSIAGLAKRSQDLAARARTRRLRLEEVQGGTFTLDNVGPIGSIISQPIINQPQCAILTMESIVKRPVVIDDAIAVRSLMNCCISFDHRIVDGGDIGPFMKTLKATLEAMGPETPLY